MSLSFKRIDISEILDHINKFHEIETFYSMNDSMIYDFFDKSSK